MPPIALVVEDDSGLRLIYNHVLTDLGYVVLEAGDGAAAIDLLQQKTPDIIFLDIKLPRVNGIQVLDFISSVPRLANSRVIVASSNRQFEHDVNAIRPVQFILKPIRPAQIRELANGSGNVDRRE